MMRAAIFLLVSIFFVILFVATERHVSEPFSAGDARVSCTVETNSPGDPYMIRNVPDLEPVAAGTWSERHICALKTGSFMSSNCGTLTSLLTGSAADAVESVGMKTDASGVRRCALTLAPGLPHDAYTELEGKLNELSVAEQTPAALAELKRLISEMKISESSLSNLKKMVELKEAENKTKRDEKLLPLQTRNSQLVYSLQQETEREANFLRAEPIEPGNSSKIDSDLAQARSEKNLLQDRLASLRTSNAQKESLKTFLVSLGQDVRSNENTYASDFTWAAQQTADRPCYSAINLYEAQNAADRDLQNMLQTNNQDGMAAWRHFLTKGTGAQATWPECAPGEPNLTPVQPPPSSFMTMQKWSGGSN